MEPMDVVEPIRMALEERADPVRAAGQQAYMRSAMPFRGVAVPEVRAAVRPLLAGWAPDRAEWEASIRELWDGASYREERYAALALARHRSAREWQRVRLLPLYRHLVVTGAWWDLVDEIAAHLVGGVLEADRGPATPVIRRWAVDDDLWLRRAAVLSQLRHKDRTDTRLLHDVVAVNVDDPSFWLRKAVGWALREYSRTDPEWVRGQVDAFGPRLSALSRREAVRRLPVATR